MAGGAGLTAEGDFAFRALGESEGGFGGGGIEIDVDDFFATPPCQHNGDIFRSLITQQGGKDSPHEQPESS